MEDNNEGMSEIQRLLQELKQSNIGFENYKQSFDKVKSSDSVIITQIANRTREYDEYKQKYLEAVGKDSFKQMAEDGFINREVFELARMMNRNIMEAFNWKTLQEEMYSIIFNKIFTVLDDARALEIKRDALKEMREMDTQRNNLQLEVNREAMSTTKEIVGGQLQVMNEKFFNLFMMNDEEHRKDRRDQFQVLSAIIKELRIDSAKVDNLINELSHKPRTQDTEQLLDTFSQDRDKVFEAPKVENKWSKESIKKHGVPDDYDWQTKQPPLVEEAKLPGEKDIGDDFGDIGEIDGNNADIIKKMGRKK